MREDSTEELKRLAAAQDEKDGLAAGAAAPQLDIHTRMTLARRLLDTTAVESGAGYLLVMWVPGSDKIYRSHHGVDTPQEAVALLRDVTDLMKARINDLTRPVRPLTNEP